MFSIIYRLFWSRWRWCATRTLQIWRALLGLVSRRDPPYNPLYLNPLTHEQRKSQEDEFIKMLDQEAIRALASSYNDHLPCRILDSKTSHGSFNICFFVNFYTVDQTWVVRIPIKPAIHNVWEKLQSEVCTMQYIQENTDIPVPRVHAYGYNRLLLNDSTEQAFMIMDCIDGRALTTKSLLNCPEERQRQFYLELVDILAQLRRLEFPAAGSLMPGPTKGAEPAIVGTFSIPMNELQQEGYPANRLTTASVAEFMNGQFRLLWETYALPTQELERSAAERELFALHTMKDQISKMGLDHHAGEPFILGHMDLRCPNIIVDDDLHIRSIIDWEWSGTVARQFFTPPTWITGDSLDLFRSVLASRKDKSFSHSQLAEEWGPGNDLVLHTVHIFRRPYSLLQTFYPLIYPQLYAEPREKVIARFFTHQENITELEKRLHSSERYTQYLKDHDLFVVDEEAQKLKEWLEKGRELLKGM